MWKKHFGTAGFAVLAALTAAGCSDLQEINAPETPEASVEANRGPAAAGGPGTAGEGACRTGESIVDLVLADDGEFDVLQAAVIDEGLVDALDGPRQVTVFAPTDAGFVSTLGVADEAAAIDFVEANDVSGILLYHVTRGVRLSPSVVNVPRIRMLNGGFVAVDGKELNDGQAELLAPDLIDLRACNGVVHAIDGMLLPS